MDRKQVKEILPILVAFAEGKAIESRCVKGDKSLWYDDEDPSFDDDFEYRIKTEPNYRPFKDAEECWTEMLRHQPFGWVKDKKDRRSVLITACENDGVFTGRNEGWNFKDIMDLYTFANGTPFGVKVEKD